MPIFSEYVENRVIEKIASKPRFLKYTLLLVAFAISQLVCAQHADSIASLKSHRFIRAVAVPATLITAGIAIQNQNQAIQKHFNNVAEDERGPKGPSRLSDYTQFAPIAAVYVFNAMNNKGEHKLLKATSLALQSEILMIAMVRPLKHFTNETRPDGGPHSFPSGHTAQAFMAATFLHKEFGHKSIWYSISGYTMATAVGACRMASNRHWASDVLVGAGIGVLSTNLVYAYHKHRKAGKKEITAMPTYVRGPGVFLSVKL